MLKFSIQISHFESVRSGGEQLLIEYEFSRAPVSDGATLLLIIPSPAPTAPSGQLLSAVRSPAGALGGTVQ